MTSINDATLREMPPRDESPLTHHVGALAAQLLEQHTDALRLRTNRNFAALMIGQWLAGIIVAWYWSPLAWAGLSSQTHPHMWMALTLGTLISGFPVCLVLLQPTGKSVPFVMAIAQMLWSALFIHLTGGRIETHFHVFGSLAFLAYYRDFRVILVATLVAVLDHLIRGVLWPQSVYSLAVPDAWRTIEHAAWVVFEDLFLLVSIRDSRTAMREIANKQATLESTNEITEQKVLDRTADLRHYTQELEVAHRTLEEQAAELEHQAESLIEARHLAEMANRAKSEFLANMSHELRTPLTSILGFAEVLLTNAKCDDELFAAGAVHRSGEHLLELINDILDLSKVEACKMEMEILPCDTCQIVAEVLSLKRPVAKAKGLTMRVEYYGAIPQTIRTDPTRLRQILLNLLGNAVKFTSRGEIMLRIGLDRSNESQPCLKFEVHDQGIGMTPEQIARLFQPFTQLDMSTTRRFGGTGLGLAISKRLTELLDGSISVSSVKGEGSMFAVTIPTGSLVDIALLDCPLEVIETPRELITVPAPSTLHGCRILLAEDGPDNQRLISHVLCKAGAQVELADNGLTAEQRARGAAAAGTAFDIILMDMQMPIMDGYAATRRLRQAGYQGAIIALTAHAMNGDKEKCIDAGCNDYATKPINRGQLIETIRRCLPNAHAQVASVL